MKRVIIILLFVSLCLKIESIPAYPRKVRFIQGNDTIWLKLQGDEYLKYATDTEGYSAIHDSLGWFYLQMNQKGEIIKSKFLVQSPTRMTQETKSFLADVPKGLCPVHSKEYMEKRRNIGVHRKTLPNAVIGNRRVLIILMQYNDVKFKKSQSDFDHLFNEKGYREDGAFGSVYDYYDKVSYGQLQLRSDVLGPYTASRNMSYYGGNDSRNGGDMNPKALFDEAIRFAIQDVKLSDYDSDGDGYVDNIHIIFAGYGEEAGASANAIWSHEMTFRTESIGGMKIDHYSCSPELRGNYGSGISRIGPPCHEIGHALGAMDFYDVDYQTGGYFEGTGEWDIMASGSWNDDGIRPADFNPYVKAYNYGWVSVQSLEQDTLNIIHPSTLKDNIYRIDTPVNGDYFLLDNRQSEGITSAEPGKGLLIFHIGPAIEQKAQTNTINATFPQYCYVVCASSSSNRPRASASSYGNINSAGCPYPGTSYNTSFSKTSTPAAYTIKGQDAGISLTNITLMPNGDISLVYGKQKADDNTPPDDPMIDDDVDGEIVWSDDFEVANYFLSQSWKQETINGDGSWIIKTYFEEDIDKTPQDGSGNRYLAMQGSKQDGLQGESLRFCCRIFSGPITLTSGDYILMGKYAGYATSKMPTDTLHVELEYSQMGTWIRVKSLRMTNRNKMSTFSIPISCNTDDIMRVSFLGSADEKSLIFLDNLKLYRPKTDDISDIFASNVDSIELYRIDGVKLGTYSKDIDILQSGIYIIRQGKYSRKVFIK